MLFRMNWFHKLKERQDSEHEQALLRIVISLGASAYAYLLYSNQKISASVMLFVAPFLIYAVANFVHIVFVPQPFPARRVVGMLADLTTASAVMYLIGEYGAVLSFVYLWVVVGNGFRYGQRYLYLGMSIGIPGFIIMAAVTPYWRGQPYVSTGFVIGLIVLPVFFLSLLKKYQKQQLATTAARDEANEKNVFLAMISHELRTPLQTIVSSIDLLATHQRNKRDAKIIQRLENAAQRLEAQMRDLIDYAKLGAGKLELNMSVFNIKNLLADVIEEHTSIVRDKAIAVTCEVSGHEGVISDPDRIRQIVGNLLVNALKYTKKGSIKVQALCQDGTEMRLVVEDTGPGIPSNKIQSLFQPFTQLDVSSTRRHEGAGMGLAIAHGLVQLLGGSIRVDSEAGRGTRIEVVLPYTPASLSTTFKTNDFASQPARESVILVVDDHEEIRESFLEMLNQLGYRCDTSPNADAAINLLASTRYDALLLDINMPHKDGYTVIEALRRRRGPNQTIPVIGISAYAQNRTELDQQGTFSERLVKPVHLEALRTTLERVLPDRSLPFVVNSQPANLAGRPVPKRKS